MSAILAISPTTQRAGKPARVVQHETAAGLKEQNSMPEHCLPSSLFLFEGFVINKTRRKSLSLPAEALVYFRGSLTRALQISLFFLCFDLRR